VPKKILKKILQALPFFFFALAFFLIIQVLVAVKNDRTPSLFGYSIFLVVSPSMEDTIMTGDIVFVDTSIKEYSVGDIITFHRPDDESVIITHRIISISELDGNLLITTQGDNNFESLDWEKNFTTDHIIGVYEGKSSFLGQIYQFIYTGGVSLIYGVVILAFLTIGVTEAISIVKALSKAKLEEDEKKKLELIEIEKERLRKEIEDEQNK